MFRSGLLSPLCCALLISGVALPALAQVDLLDPDVPAVKKTKPQKPSKPARPEEEAPASASAPDPEPREEERPAGKAPVRPEPSTATADAKADPGARPQPAKVPEPRKPEPKKGAEGGTKVDVAPLSITRATDTDLVAAWEKWRLANASSNAAAEAAARLELLQLKKEIGARDLEAFSQGMLRAALAHEASGDSTGAIDLGLTAVELAPDSPSAWRGLTRVYFAVDPADLPRTLGALKTSVSKMIADPRSLRPALADFANAGLTALIALAAAVVAVLFARRSRYFFYDFHFLFPRAMSRWQSTAVAVLILLVPIVFRMGVVTALLVAFAAVALYLGTAERVVAASLISLLGLVPSLGEKTVERTAFAGTPAEAAYLLDQGADGTEPLAQQLSRLATEEKASFAELFALGTWELHRGKLEAALRHLKASLQRKPNDPRAEVNLGVAMLLSGDLENPKVLFEDGARLDPTRVEPLYDLARLYQRRGLTFGRDVAAAEIDRYSQAMTGARARNPSIAEPTEPAAPEKLLGNLAVLTLPLATGDLLSLAVAPDAAERVGAQLRLFLVGDLPEPIAPYVPLVAALLLLALGSLGKPLAVARPCIKCGSPVSRRGDQDVTKGATMCTQCVNVFARKGVVPPALKVRKQIEVSRYLLRSGRVSYALGLVCSGLGHVFSGRVVRGTVYAFLFLLMIVLFFQRHGVVRAPYEAFPLTLRLVPLGLVFGLVYLLSLRGLYKRQP